MIDDAGFGCPKVTKVYNSWGDENIAISLIGETVDNDCYKVDWVAIEARLKSRGRLSSAPRSSSSMNDSIEMGVDISNLQRCVAQLDCHSTAARQDESVADIDLSTLFCALVPGVN